jgi:hypothetical protein
MLTMDPGVSRFVYLSEARTVSIIHPQLMERSICLGGLSVERRIKAFSSDSTFPAGIPSKMRDFRLYGHECGSLRFQDSRIS